MARKRVKANLRYDIEQTFKSKLAIGRSKYDDQQNGVDTRKYIYSYSTFENYMRTANYFASWAKENYGCKTLAECRKYADDWIRHLKDRELSAYTQKAYLASLTKLYGEPASNFEPTEERRRSDISKSRHDAIRDRNFNEELHSDLVSFCRSTGLRRSELEALTGDKLGQYDDGGYYIVVDIGSKGGRYRESPVIGDVDLVVGMMDRAGNSKVFERVSGDADIHAYRADYATALYLENARPIEDIPYDAVNAGSGYSYQSDVYCRRGEMAGSKLDKQAMEIVSSALGHNRISVIAGHYLRGI